MDNRLNGLGELHGQLGESDEYCRARTLEWTWRVNLGFPDIGTRLNSASCMETRRVSGGFHDYSSSGRT